MLFQRTGKKPLWSCLNLHLAENPMPHCFDLPGCSPWKHSRGTGQSIILNIAGASSGNVASCYWSYITERQWVPAGWQLTPNSSSPLMVVASDLGLCAHENPKPSCSKSDPDTYSLEMSSIVFVIGVWQFCNLLTATWCVSTGASLSTGENKFPYMLHLYSNRWVWLVCRYQNLSFKTKVTSSLTLCISWVDKYMYLQSVPEEITAANKSCYFQIYQLDMKYKNIWRPIGFFLTVNLKWVFNYFDDTTLCLTLRRIRDMEPVGPCLHPSPATTKGGPYHSCPTGDPDMRNCLWSSPWLSSLPKKIKNINTELQGLLHFSRGHGSLQRCLYTKTHNKYWVWVKQLMPQSVWPLCVCVGGD